MGSSPADLTNVGSKLMFTADDGAHGTELWKSDGTKRGTKLVEDINPAGSSNPSYLLNVGGQLFFGADDDTTAPSSWKSDGTKRGPSSWRTSIPEAPRARPNSGGSTARFTCPRTTASAAMSLALGWLKRGTRLVKDINHGGGASNPYYMTRLGNRLLLQASDGTHSDELWRTDGTKRGTKLVQGHQPRRLELEHPGLGRLGRPPVRRDPRRVRHELGNRTERARGRSSSRTSAPTNDGPFGMTNDAGDAVLHHRRRVTETRSGARTGPGGERGSPRTRTCVELGSGLAHGSGKARPSSSRPTTARTARSSESGPERWR